jgi:PST family polysaccharide transporter
MIDWGPYALVTQQITGAVVGLAAVCVAARWVPGLPRRGAHIRPLLSFGSNLLASQVIAYSTKNADTIVIGARFGASAVGVYDRAFQLLMVPLMQLNAPFTRVALPTLSRLQDDPGTFERYLLRAHKTLLWTMLPIVALVGSQAIPIISILLGENWKPSATILQILAIGGAFHLLYYPTFWVFLAKGLTRRFLYFNVLTRIPMIILIVVSSMGGVTGVAIGYAAGVALQWPLGLLWTRNVPGVSSGVMLWNGSRILAVVLASAVPGLVISTWWQPFNAPGDCAVGLILMALVLGIIMMMSRTVRGDISEVVELLNKARGSK